MNDNNSHSVEVRGFKSHLPHLTRATLVSRDHLFLGMLEQ